MKVEFHWNQGVHFSAKGGSGLPLEIDGPPDIGGRNLGIRPMELMLMGVGACTSVDVMHILRKARCSIQACGTTISAEREDADPKVFKKIHIHLELSGESLSANKVNRAIRLSADKYCSASIMMKRAGVEISHDWAIVPLGEHEKSQSSFHVEKSRSMLGMHHVALLSARYKESRRFYTELMGMNIEWEPDHDNIYLTSGTDNLAIHRKNSDEQSLETRLDHIGFVVANESMVDSWFEYLQREGVPISAPPKTHRDGSRSCYVLDPDATQVQIIHHPPLVAALSKTKFVNGN